MPIELKNKLIVPFIIIFGTLSFPMPESVCCRSQREREFIYQVHIHNIYISIITMAGCQ